MNEKRRGRPRPDAAGTPPTIPAGGPRPSLVLWFDVVHVFQVAVGREQTLGGERSRARVLHDAKSPIPVDKTYLKKTGSNSL